MAVSDKDKVKLKARLYMKFTGESGLDYGGLARLVCVFVYVCVQTYIVEGGDGGSKGFMEPPFERASILLD